MDFGLNQGDTDKIINCLAKYSNIDEALIYGSRAKGNFKSGSDIDLTLKGSGITLNILSQIENDLDNLLLPYKIDLSIFNKIENADLINHIERVGRLFYKKK